MLKNVANKSDYETVATYTNRITTSNVDRPCVILLLGNPDEEEERLKDPADKVQRLGVVRTLLGHVDQQLGKSYR